jgi:membrane associated rhomboid family serine protease
MTTTQTLRTSIVVPLKFIAILWIIQLFQWISPFDLGYLGIYPRTVSGLKGILLSPLLHSGFDHLVSNTPPLLVLWAMVLFFYPRIATPVFILIYLLTGLSVWLFARPVYHIGASGVIYGLVAFVFWSGIFRRNIRAIALALVVAFYYGSMFMGILPIKPGVSWESHLMGGIAGILVAFLYKNNTEGEEQKPTYSWENETEREQFFLDRDTFDKTRSEREANKRTDFPNWFSTRT